MCIKEPDDPQWSDVPEFIILGNNKLFIRDIQGRDECVKGQGQDTACRKGDLRIRDVPVLKEPYQEPFPETLRVINPHPVLISPDLPG